VKKRYWRSSKADCVLGGDSDGLGFFILGHCLLDLLVESLRALLDGSILCAVT
jgi:hypothetical protein